MKHFLALALLSALLGAGCVSKSTANAQARAAYLEGKREGMAAAAQGPSVWVIGNVKKPVIAWTPDLTLTEAIVKAEYRGAKDPSQIIVRRKDQQPLQLRAQQLLEGQDMPLLNGDQIEIVP